MEHEMTRQEHRRRFEEQMQLLESKQQRDEAMLKGVEEETSRTFGPLPVTPIKTPGQIESRSRANTTTKSTPPLKVFESRVTLNEQLVTPPSDQHTRSSPSSFAPAQSVPGSRRTSASIGFENLSLNEYVNFRSSRDKFTKSTSHESRRMSYIDHGKSIAHNEHHRSSIQKMFNDEGILY